MKNVYEARTFEDIQRDGYPNLRADELKRLDFWKRTEQTMADNGLYGECIVH